MKCAGGGAPGDAFSHRSVQLLQMFTEEGEGGWCAKSKADRVVKRTGCPSLPLGILPPGVPALFHLLKHDLLDGGVSGSGGSQAPLCLVPSLLLLPRFRPELGPELLQSNSGVGGLHCRRICTCRLGGGCRLGMLRITSCF